MENFRRRLSINNNSPLYKELLESRSEITSTSLIIEL